MWFAFGFITLISFSIYTAQKYHKVRWRGLPGYSDKGEYEYNIRRQRHRSFTLYLGIKGLDEYDFYFKRESIIDRFFKFIGVSVEHQIGQDEFDKQIYIVSDDLYLKNKITKNQQLTQSILAIFNVKKDYLCTVKEIRCLSGRLWVKCRTHKGFDELPLSEFADKITPHLVHIQKALNKNKAERSKKPKDPFILKSAIILAISSGLAINGLLQFLRSTWNNIPYTIDLSTLWYDGLIIGGGFIAVLMIITLYFLGRTARTHLILIELLIVGLFGSVSTAVVELSDINMELDTSTIKQYRERVLSKRISKSTKSTTYYVTVKNWNEPGQEKELAVSSDFFYNVQSRDILLIDEKKGYLNYRWVEDITRWEPFRSKYRP